MADTVSHIDMPIEEYLRGVVGYQIADNALNSILFKRKIAAEAMASSLTEKQLDLVLLTFIYGVQLLPVHKIIRKTAMADGSTLKVAGRLQLLIRGSCGLWQKSYMRNGERTCRVKVK